MYESSWWMMWCINLIRFSTLWAFGWKALRFESGNIRKSNWAIDRYSSEESALENSTVYFTQQKSNKKFQLKSALCSSGAFEFFTENPIALGSPKFSGRFPWKCLQNNGCGKHFAYPEHHKKLLKFLYIVKFKWSFFSDQMMNHALAKMKRESN